MFFKKHPYYDNRGGEQWLSLETPDFHDLANFSADEWLIDQGETRPNSHIAKLVQAAKDQQDDLYALALDRMQRHVGEAYLAERPYPQWTEFLIGYFTMTGFQVYIECFFTEYESAISGHRDVWWVIIDCPQHKVTDFGWYIEPS